jgi:tellurite resistance protein TerC
MEITSVGTPILWAGFTLLVLVPLALDLGVFHRQAREVRFGEAIVWNLAWIALALLFNGWVSWSLGAERGVEFFTGYLLERALAVDNIFVFLVVFSAFAVPSAYQHRVLFWGILGALVMRAVFIVLGAVLLEAFHWVMYLFGGFLVLTGIKLLVQRAAEVHPERNPLFRLFRRLVPSVTEYHGARFMVMQGGRRYATPLLLVLACIETADVAFAVDSIPAIFAVTRDPFIVYTSNIFAILGLRALFFLLAGVMHRFRYLKVGLAVVLVFVGVKMLLVDVYKIPIVTSLGVIATMLAMSIGASWLWPPVSEAPTARTGDTIPSVDRLAIGDRRPRGNVRVQ